ncbi:MAG: CPBP family intramembrane metalloprotease [Actinomycetota bacterium]|nr:CPBP family intramembrane metalloprotease [Actinomycetota bacterium]
MRAVFVLVGMLTLRNVAGITLVPQDLYVPVNLAVTAALALVGRASGVSASELGLSRATVARGLRIGAAGAALVAVVLVVAGAVPLTRPLFEDQRVADVDSGGALAYQALVRIPLGTVVLEEFAFRGVLLAALARHRSTGVAVAVSSSLFGLWHIRPTLSALETNELAADPMARFAAVAAAVAFTALAGMVFCGLRLASRSLLAPVLVHTATNSVSMVVAYVVLGG